MMDAQALTELVREIVSQGYSEATASDYAVRIGDTPIMDEAGNVIVMDSGNQVMATLKPLEFFSDL